MSRGMTSDEQSRQDALLLRIFIGEDDRFENAPLYETIVLKAREMRMAGATVLRGPMGYGHSSLVHTTKVLRLAQDLPLVIEIVDSKNKIEIFLQMLAGIMTGGLVTMEKVTMVQFS